MWDQCGNCFFSFTPMVLLTLAVLFPKKIVVLGVGCMGFSVDGEPVLLQCSCSGVYFPCRLVAGGLKYL